ncbi:MAG TPA: DinB family protein [Pyrinomonadaceae bacterium]|nr:DinB family protein [Pyrinomonadaceae bacterium]
MIYQSIADIYAANDTVRRKLTERVENLSEAQQHFRPADNAWSIAEIIEHLAMLEQQMVQLIGMLLKKSESASAATATAGEGAAGGTSASGFQPFSLDSFIDQVRDEKLTAPEQVRPSGGVSLAEGLTNLRRTRAELEGLRPRLEAASNLNAATFPHPAFGAFNSAQWLAFIGLHEGRHLQQIENLMAAPGFKQGEG